MVVGGSRVGTRTIQSIPHPLGASSSSSSSSSHLPEWLQSALSVALGGAQPSVKYNLPGIREKWVHSLPEALRGEAKVAHVYPCWCALKMAEGELVLHNSNGTIVAVDKDKQTVYLACATGQHKITRTTKLSPLVNVVSKKSKTDEHGHVIPVTGGVAMEMCVHWVMLSKSDLKTLMEKKGI